MFRPLSEQRRQKKYPTRHTTASNAPRVLDGIARVLHFASPRNPELTESIAIWAREGHYTDVLGIVQQLKDVCNVAAPADPVSAGLRPRAV